MTVLFAQTQEVANLKECFLVITGTKCHAKARIAYRNLFYLSDEHKTLHFFFLFNPSFLASQHLISSETSYGNLKKTVKAQSEPGITEDAAAELKSNQE